MLLTSLMLALQPAPVPAANSLEFDLACVSVVSAAAQQKADLAPRLMPLSTFYVGRIDARGASDAELEAAGSAITKTLLGKEIQPVFDACAAKFQTAGQRLNSLAVAKSAAAPAPTTGGR